MTGKVSQCYLSKTYLKYLGGFKLTLDITRKIIICIIYSHFYCISSTYNKLKMVVKKSTKPLWTSNWVACGPLPLSFFSATIQSKRKRKMKNKKKALEKQNGQNKCSHESWMIAASLNQTENQESQLQTTSELQSVLSRIHFGFRTVRFSSM